MHFARLTVAPVDSFSTLLLLFIVKYIEITIHYDKQIFMTKNKEYSHALYIQWLLEVTALV